MNFHSKFVISKFEHGNEILMSQANLLLSASSVLDIADSMIHRHYAQRAYPVNGLNFGLAHQAGVCQFDIFAKTGIVLLHGIARGAFIAVEGVAVLRPTRHEPCTCEQCPNMTHDVSL